MRTVASMSCNGCTTAFTWLRLISSVRRRSASAVTVPMASGSACSLRIDSKYRSKRPRSVASACSAAARRAATRSADFSWRWPKRSRSRSPGARAGTRAAFPASDGSAGSTRPASKSRNAPATSSPTLAPAGRLKTPRTGVGGPGKPAAGPGAGSAWCDWGGARPASRRRARSSAGAAAGCERRRADRRRRPTSHGRGSALPLKRRRHARLRADAEPRVYPRPCDGVCEDVSRGLGLDVHEREGKPIRLRDERDRASGAGQAREPHQISVFGMATGRLLRRDAPDRLDRLERLEQFRHVHAELVTFRLPPRGFDDLARAEPESQAAGNRQRLEPALEPHGVVVRRDEGIELFLLLARRAALLDLGAHRLHAAREVFLAVGGEPLFRQPALELLRATEFAEDQVQLAHHQLEQLDLPVEQLEDIRLDRPGGGQVHDVDLARLPDAVQAADALLHHHRVPRQVVVHEHIAELEVPSFAASAGGDQHAARVLVESPDALVPIGRRVSTPIDDRLPAELLHALLDQLDRRAVIAEDHETVRRFLEQFGQHVQLGVGLDALRPLGELLRDRAVLGADALALGQVRERFGERPRRGAEALAQVDDGELQNALLGRSPPWRPVLRLFLLDRKSTRLNSSHGYISYAVFCLKKKKTTYEMPLKVATN